MGLKGNQPELFAEALRLLEPKAKAQPPEAETPWERRNGKRIRRRLREKTADGGILAPMSWRSLFKVIEDALLLSLEPVRVG